MTMSSVLSDISLLLVFLLIGFIIRELVKPFQKLYIPASMIGGLLALICGQQVLGLVELPESFGQISGTFISLVMTALVFGISLTKQRVKGYLDFTMVMLITYGTQLAIGTALGMGLGKIWTNLPKGWGTMGVFAFFGGHGNSAAAGSVYQELGIQDNLGIGMILSTFGMIIAIGIGMIIVNWGARNGHAKYLEGETGELKVSNLGGVLPDEEQKSIGTEKVNSSGISSYALQFSFLALSMVVGSKLIDSIASIVPALAMIPGMARGMVGAAIVWGIMSKAGLDGYADKRTISTISGFALELIITSAVATIRLEVLSTFLIPLLIFTLVMIILMFFISFYIVPRICKIDWFEKMLLNFGQGTGNASTGLALVRAADPNFYSTAPESTGVGSAVLVPITGTFPALIPILVVQSELTVIVIGIVLTIISIVIMKKFLWGESQL